MTKPLPCPYCGKFGTMVVEGNLRCITTNTKIGCGWNEPIGTTKDEIAKAKAKAKAKADAEAEAEAEARAKADAEAEAEAEARAKAKAKAKAKDDAEAKARAIELKAIKKATALVKKNHEILEEKIRDKEDPPFRISEYLDSNVRSEFQRGGDYHIYLIELEEPRFRTSCTFPNSEYRLNTDFDSATGYVWIGIANMEVVEDFRRLVRGNSSDLIIRVMLEHKTSPDFEICGRALTEQFGFTEIETSENADFLQAWLGWALYKAGYWVWLGPNPHPNNDLITTNGWRRRDHTYNRKLAMDNIGSRPFL